MPRSCWASPRRTIYNRIRDGRLHTIRTARRFPARAPPSRSNPSICVPRFRRCTGRLTRASSTLEPAMTLRMPRAQLLNPATALAIAALMLGSASPAYAAHRARLSADLADHLAVGSQTIDVIAPRHPRRNQHTRQPLQRADQEDAQGRRRPPGDGRPARRAEQRRKRRSLRPATCAFNRAPSR